MVNIFLQFDKSFFSSKRATVRLKSDIRNLFDKGINIESYDEHIQCNNYLNNEKSGKFLFSKVNDDIFIKYLLSNDNNLFSTKSDLELENKLKNFRLNKSEEEKLEDKKKKNKQLLDNKLGKLKEERLNTEGRELKKLKKDYKDSKDSKLFKKYENLRVNFGAPVETPHELINNLEKYKDQIQIFASGFLEVTSEVSINNLVVDYYKQISNELNLNILTEEEFKNKVGIS